MLQGGRASEKIFKQIMLQFGDIELFEYKHRFRPFISSKQEKLKRLKLELAAVFDQGEVFVKAT